MNEDKGIAHNQYWDDEDEILNPEAFALHPGPFFKRNVLAVHDISVSRLANHIMVARPGLNDALNGKRAVTAGLALKLERATGYPAVILCSMQSTHDLAHDRAEFEPEIEHIEPIRAYA